MNMCFKENKQKISLRTAQTYRSVMCACDKGINTVFPQNDINLSVCESLLEVFSDVRFGLLLMDYPNVLKYWDT